MDDGKGEGLTPKLQNSYRSAETVQKTTQAFGILHKNGKIINKDNWERFKNSSKDN